MKHVKKAMLIAALLLCYATSYSQWVSIGGNKFYVEGKEIFFNGVNTAWQPQADWSLDFLGRNFDSNWWNNEFQRYVDNRINLARIWIHGAGNYSPSLNGDGMVTGASSQFWSQMDQLVAMARQKKVYIMPTFWSFDMVKNQGSSYYNQFRQIINDVNKTQWYIDNFLRPFLQRYENEPYVMGYDICNEPEHMWRDANCGNLNKNNVVRFVARCAAAINQYSTKPVTVGSMWIIFNSSKYTGWDIYGGNNYSNASLQAQYNSGYAYLDFWSPHWYQWQSSGGPFNTTIGAWMDNGDKPSLIGETPGYDVAPGGNMNCCNWNITLANYYKQAYWNGYAGVCAWKNPHEDDGYGYFNSIRVATNDFYANYPNLVYPVSGSGIVSGATYRLLARHSNKALDVNGGMSATQNGANVHQWDYLGATNQQWIVTDLGGSYYRLTAVHSGKALEVVNWYTNDGANVQQNTYSSGANQQWTIESVGSGYYRLINRYSGKALEVAGGTSATQNGANVQQWAYLSATNQQWQLVRLSGGAREAAPAVVDEMGEEAVAYPNPFIDKIFIPVTLKHAGKVRVTVFNAMGQLESVVPEQLLEAGQHVITWEAKTKEGKMSLPGMYIYKVYTPDGISTGKVMKRE